MSYRDVLGNLNVPDDNCVTEPNERQRTKNTNHGYDHVRFGTPQGVIDFEGVKSDRDKLLKHVYNHGWSTWPHKDIGLNFKKHVALFRASLDIWEQFSKEKVFCKEELYVRCLQEGPAFTDFIKKSRATCLRAMSAETDTAIEEEYLHDNYTGYNSIIHERYLIHWDDRKDINDYLYSFIELKENNRNIETFRGYVRDMFDENRIHEENFPEQIDMLRGLQPTKMYDPTQKKTFLMREFWDDGININSPWYAKRSVVPVSPGGTRDTGIGDPSSILKVKTLNMLARIVSDKLPHSANTDGPTANARYKRVLKKNCFLHLDFKKFGLTIPRRLTNVVIEEIGRVSGLDVSDLLIHSFHLEIDGNVYETERGTVLGWLDCINAIGINAILCNLSREGLAFDHIGFNDDFELSKRAVSDVKGTLEILRTVVCSELSSWDIPISLSKTYGSRASVFLERYAYFTRFYDLDMYKEQLTVKAYAKSLVTTEKWQAKLLYATAELWTKSQYCTDRCIDTIDIEFRKEERTLPLWSGGWFIPMKNRLDHSLEMSDRLGLRLGNELGKFKPKAYASKVQRPASNDKIRETIISKSYFSYSAGLRRLETGFNETVDKINDELDWFESALRTQTDLYEGRSNDFANIAFALVEKAKADLLDHG